MTQESTSNGLTLDQAYAVCRSIAKREAKNFYYAFVALPTTRRNAICAIYAFMRRADDLADDESFSTAERRAPTGCVAEPHGAAVSGGAQTADPVFLAVRDATTRFAIPLSLLDELVAGVTMDLDRAETGAPDTYATFADLYRTATWWLRWWAWSAFASLATRIPRAEKLAEETGIAFQLTNILRDVAEDAERNRVYLPLEDLGAHNVSLESLLHRAAGAPPTADERALLAEHCQRAEDYYRSARGAAAVYRSAKAGLRCGCWLSIYHALLKRIERADYDVFSRRASVPLRQKLAILAVRPDAHDVGAAVCLRRQTGE